MHALRDRDDLQKILERKVDLAIQGESETQQKLYEAETEIEAKNWEKPNRDQSFQEIIQEVESQQCQLHQASRWADQAQRDKLRLYGELELRSRLFQENHARDCHVDRESFPQCWLIRWERALREHGETVQHDVVWTHGGSRVARYRPEHDVKNGHARIWPNRIWPKPHLARISVSKC